MRGCIGTFGSSKLGNTLQKYSLIAAVQDTRFNPMSHQDLNSSLRCEISLLSDFEVIQNPLDWEVGKHGIEIEFKGPENSHAENKVFRGTYLPNVASEQEWNQQETLMSLLKKAGFNGHIDLVINRFVLIRRY